MKVFFKLYAASGSCAGATFDTADPGNGSASLLFLTLDEVPVTVTVRKADAVTGCEMVPFVFSFKAEREIALARAQVYAEFPEGEGDVYYYDAGCCTNSFAGIHPYRGEDTDRGFYARDLFMAHRGGKEETAPYLNMAFATFRRFYTRFRLEDGGAAAEYELEGKTVRAGETYELEYLFLDNVMNASDFFEQYAIYLAETFSIPKFKYTPKGWSSWSCYYGDIDEQKVILQAELVAKELSPFGADLIQLDDGWQKEGSFGAYWTTNTERFPSGIEGLQQKIAALGLRFGIWVAPGLVKDSSSRFEELYDLLVKQPDGSILKAFGGGEALAGDKDGSVYAMDLGDPEVLKKTAEIFERCMKEYGAEYFKVDFITNLLLRMAFMTPVTYPGDYSVALYRKWIHMIRETVGGEVFLLACGAPVGESAGVFDSIRISPDISWGGAGKNGLPAPFEIIRNDAQNILLRSPYHNRVFVNDPDALLVRNYYSEHGDDGLLLSDDEAMLWATVVFLSGGHILLNEEIEKLPAGRLNLVKKVLELSLSMNRTHTAARAKDFFEFPYCSEAYIPQEPGASAETLFVKMAKGEKLGENASVICALMNWSEEPLKKTFRAADYFDASVISGDCKDGVHFHAYDIWNEKTYAPFENDLDVPVLAPHSCVLLKVAVLEEKNKIPLF